MKPLYETILITLYMANFKITPTTTVAELKKQFSNEVGGVLRVYEGRSEAADDATLVSLGAKEGELECRTSRTVGKFEEAFQSDLNLKVKVYTKDNWVKVLDGITLATAAELPNGMTKAKMEEYLSYKRDEKEEENAEVESEEITESVEVPEEYKGLPIIEITTEEIDIDDPYGSFPSYPTYGVVFHGYESDGRKAIIIMADKHRDLCKQAAKDIEKYIASDEDIPLKVIETKTINGYGKADDVEEIKGVIGVALNEYYDGGWKHLYQYEWENWFPNEAIFCIDDDVFIASKDGSIDFTDVEDLSIEQLNALKASFFDFHDGLAKKEDDGKWGFIYKSGVFVIPAKFDDVQDFSEGLCAVEIDGSWGFIDTNGKIVIEPQFLRGADFQNGQCEVMTDEYDLTIDKKGNVIKRVKSEW